MSRSPENKNELEMGRKGPRTNDVGSHEARLADPVTGTIGQFGRWQLWVCAVVFMMKFPVGWHQLATVFLAPPANFECVEPNGTDKCSAECQAIEFDRSIFKETIVTEWGLICDKKYLANLAQTIFMFGILVGNIVFGIWSDKIGRRPPLVVAMIMQLICGVLNAFVPWFWAYCVLRFLLAVSTGGSMITSFVLIMEITGSKKRESMSILYQIPFNIGHSTLPLFAYFIRDWRWFQFALSIISVIFISYYWLLPESPRWLITTGKLDKAEKLLTKAAKMNRLPTKDIRSDLEEASKKKLAEQDENQKKGTLLDLFRYPNLRIKTICMSFNWLVCGLTFFGVSQYIGEISGNIFINVAIAGLLGIPGTLISIPMTTYLGRKKSLIISNLLAGVCMLAIAILPQDSSWITVALASIGVFGMSISFPNVYLYGGELFPTVVRNAGMGFASMIARIGSMAAPFVSQAGVVAYWLPPLIFGVIPVIGAVLVLLLPETKGFPLPETIEDGETFGKKISKNVENASK